MELEPFTPEEQARIDEIVSRVKTDPMSIKWIKPEPGEWTGRTLSASEGQAVTVEGHGLAEHLKRKPEDHK